MDSCGALRAIGVAIVAITLAFVLLPALVVAIAAFNARAVLAFPPDALSLRWFAKVAYCAHRVSSLPGCW